MPIYEYQCQKCEKGFEYMQSINDPPKKKCEACGGKLEKLISASGFVLKGGGWYKDLYASAKPGSSSDSVSSPAPVTKSEKGEKSEKSESKAPSSTSSETKSSKPAKASKAKD